MPQIQYLLGEEIVCQPDGREIERYDVLLQRTLDPLERRIVEEFVLDEPDIPPERYRYVLLVDPAAATFQVTNDQGQQIGHGTLKGPVWRWNQWQTHSNIGGIQRVVSDHWLDEQGLRVDATIYDQQGEPKARLRQYLQHVDQVTYLQRRHELLRDR